MARFLASLLGEQLPGPVNLGNVTVGVAAIAGGQFVAFNNANGLTDGDNFYYVIKDQAGPKWEYGIGKYVAASTSFIREFPLMSSESTGQRANFTDPVYVFAVVPVTTLAAAGAGTAPGVLY